MDETKLVKMVADDVRRVVRMLKSVGQGAVSPQTALSYAQANLAFLPGFIADQMNSIRQAALNPKPPDKSTPLPDKVLVVEKRSK